MPVSRSVTEASRFQRSRPARPRSGCASRARRGVVRGSSITPTRGSRVQPVRLSARGIAAGSVRSCRECCWPRPSHYQRYRRQFDRVNRADTVGVDDGGVVRPVIGEMDEAVEPTACQAAVSRACIGKISDVSVEATFQPTTPREYTSVMNTTTAYSSDPGSSVAPENLRVYRLNSVAQSTRAPSLH